MPKRVIQEIDLYDSDTSGPLNPSHDNKTETVEKPSETKVKNKKPPPKSEEVVPETKTPVPTVPETPAVEMKEEQVPPPVKKQHRRGKKMPAIKEEEETPTKGMNESSWQKRTKKLQEKWRQEWEKEQRLNFQQEFQVIF